MSREFLVTSAKTRMLQASVLLVFALFLVLLVVQEVMFPEPARQLANNRSELATGSTIAQNSSVTAHTASAREAPQPCPGHSPCLRNNAPAQP